MSWRSAGLQTERQEISHSRDQRVNQVVWKHPLRETPLDTEEKDAHGVSIIIANADSWDIRCTKKKNKQTRLNRY